MTDNLRDRIAAVLTDHGAGADAWGVDGCECGFGTSSLIEQATHQADVLIRELGLMIDDSYRIGYGNAFIVHGYYEVRESR